MDELQKVEYPARLVLSRFSPNYNPPAKVMVDPDVIVDDADLVRVTGIYHNIALAGGIPYTMTLANVNDVDRVVAERWAEMEALANPGKARESYLPTAPAVATPAAPAPATLLDRAYEAARKAFADQPAALERLAEALAVVKANGVQDLGNGNWRVTTSADSYLVNGSCGCADFGLLGGKWCCHRLAVALVRKMRELREEKGAGCAANTPAPTAPAKRTNPRSQYTTRRRATQAAR